MDDRDKQIQMLQNPLLTEDGFLNQACMNELESFINNMPRIYEQNQDDPEWNTPRVTHVKYITGAFASWAVRQGENRGCPPNLENIVKFLDACLRSEFVKKEDNVWTRDGWGEFSLNTISRLLYDIVYDLPIFREWNTEECLGKGWLDLDALLRNVCISIRDERRANDAFDAAFDVKGSEQCG